MYGEQDFLNVHFAGRHARLDLEYKCSAEKMAEAGREESWKPCGLVEFDSCPAEAGRVAWKPWHGTWMFGDEHFKVCFRPPDAKIVDLAERWLAAHGRAMEVLKTRGGPELRPARKYH